MMPVQIVGQDQLDGEPLPGQGTGEIVALPVFPEVHDDGEHGAGVQHDQEHGHFGARGVQAHQFFRDDDVGGAGDGQQFAGALDDGQEHDLEDIHPLRKPRGWGHFFLPNMKSRAPLDSSLVAWTFNWPRIECQPM